MEPFRQPLSRREFMQAAGKALMIAIAQLLLGCSPKRAPEQSEFKPAITLPDKLENLGLAYLELLIPIKQAYEESYGTFPTIGLHQFLELLQMLENNVRSKRIEELGSVLSGAWSTETDMLAYAQRHVDSIDIQYAESPLPIDPVRNFLRGLASVAPVLVASLPSAIRVSLSGAGTTETTLTTPPLPPSNDEALITFLHEMWHMLDGDESTLYRIKPLVFRKDYIAWVFNLMKIEQEYIHAVVDEYDDIAAAGIWIHNWNDQNQIAAQSLVAKIASLNLTLATGIPEINTDHITLDKLISYWTASIKSAAKMQMARSQAERYALNLESQALYRIVFREGLSSDDGSMRAESLFQACNHKLIEPPTISTNEPPFVAIPDYLTSFPTDRLTALRVQMLLERLRLTTSLDVDDTDILALLRKLFSLTPHTF